MILAVFPKTSWKVFRPFYALMMRAMQTGGTGLGLAIARDVARGHGGDIVLSKSALGGLRGNYAAHNHPRHRFRAGFPLRFWPTHRHVLWRLAWRDAWSTNPPVSPISTSNAASVVPPR